MRGYTQEQMQTIAHLNDNFAIADVLSFEEVADGLLIARVSCASCHATLFLHGAHLVHWQPTGHEPVLFLSSKSAFAPDKAIRGGVPVIFPWFGPRTGERIDGPMHGFARTAVWDVAFAAQSGDDVHLTLTLGPSETSRALGYDHFRVAFEVVLGEALTMRLSVANQGEAPLHFEEALHTYFAIGGIESVRLHGLCGTEFLDKTDNFARKRQDDDTLMIGGETDRPYLNTEATVTIEDTVELRRIVVVKRNSQTTVVWNPWAEKAAKLADLGDEEWHHFVCVETANAVENGITLQPGEAHTMEARVSVGPLPAEPEAATSKPAQAEA